MPIRRSPSNRSQPASTSAHTRAMIAPTVRQAIRISSLTAVFEHCVASQATVSSKARVCPAPWRAHGTCATTTPCSGQRTRGASASSNTRTVPTSRARQRRRPSPASYRAHRRTADPAPTSRRPRHPTSTMSWRSLLHFELDALINVLLSTPSKVRHNLTLRTSFPAPGS